MKPLTADELQNWDSSSRREWLLTNGIGGYASGTVAGANTRRYHGLLVAACTPPLDRTVVISKLEEEVKIEEQSYALSSNHYPHVIYPQGFRHLTAFSISPVVSFEYLIHEGTVRIEKRIWMRNGYNTVYIDYTVLAAPEPFLLTLSPFMSYKNYHTELHRWDGFVGKTQIGTDGRVLFQAFENALPVRMRIEHPRSMAFEPQSNWYFNYEHEREEERGLDGFEDLYCAGRWTGMVREFERVAFCGTVEEETQPLADQAYQDETRRRDRLISLSGTKANSPLTDLVIAADQFVIPTSDRVSRATVIAGYPWFTDWGRDTFIALEGLCLSTGRADTARDILTSFTNAMTDGMIPNRFSDNGGGADYNTVDGTLWYVQAASAYVRHTGDHKLVADVLYPAVKEIVARHRAGTHFNIHVDPEDGLLYAGEPGAQLTWMDAKVGDWVVTPRTGKPVEIQALWYNTLRIAADLADLAKDDSADYRKAAEQVSKSFADRFVFSEGGYLYDVIDTAGLPGVDSSLRPNQVLALGLLYPVLDPSSAIARTMLDIVKGTLLTPFGLRTLAPGSDGYRDHYGPGDALARDGAYHMGTVWPWLLGNYATACKRVYGNKFNTKVLFQQLLDGMNTYGVGSIAEIFDAEKPFAPNGCIAQAWSVAETLRILKGSL
jgi:predicted glycogen debranching enzyme